MRLLALLLVSAVLAACAESQNSLQGESVSTPDSYLEGTWYFAALDDNGTLVTTTNFEYLVVRLDGDTLFITYHEEQKATTLQAITSQVGATRYLSMRPVEITGHNENPSDEIPGQCPYQILRYQTYMPDPLPEFEYASDTISDRSSSEAANESVIRRNNSHMRGQLLFVDIMAPDVVGEYIEQGDLEGYLGGPFLSPFITASSDQIRAFLDKERDSIYTGEAWLPLIRSTAQ
jgi:hypothetical protein